MKWIIDTDIGDDIDDFYAIGHALACRLEIIGVTTVFRSCELRARLAKYCALKMGADIPVYVGEDSPIATPTDEHCKPQRWLSPSLYGKFLQTGEKWLPQMLKEAEDMKAEELPAVEFLAESASKYGSELGIIAIGPLTNLAKAIKKYPSQMKGIGALYIMGGNLISPRPEWNVRLDAEACYEVYRLPCEKFIVGADQTWTNGVVDYEQTLNGTASSKAVLELEQKLLKLWRDQPLYEKKNPCLHDVIVVDAIVHADEYTFEQAHARVILEGEQRGVTLASSPAEGQAFKINVLTKMSESRFKSNFYAAMKAL